MTILFSDYKEGADKKNKPEILKKKWWFILVKEDWQFWILFNLKLEDYSNLSLVNKCKDFSVEEDNKDYTILKVETTDNEIQIVKIPKKDGEIVIEESEEKKFDSFSWQYKNYTDYSFSWQYKNYTDYSLRFIVYKKDSLQQCEAKFDGRTKWSNTIIVGWKYETEEDLQIQKKYFWWSTSIKNQFFSLFK